MPREMKDSGIEWIGEIPSHWEVRKVKNYYTMQTGFTPDTKNELYYDDIDGYDWVNISDIQDGKIITETKKKISQYYVDTFTPQIIPQGSLLYSFKLSVGQTAYAGKPIYSNEAIASFLPDHNINLHYLRYSSVFIIENAQINIYNAKILNQELINNAYIIFPPLAEQKTIADFLDTKCAEIDAVIEQTKATIEEYKKLKQSVITEAVTKGIRGDRPMKDSGIEWIGKMPSEWKLVQLKRYAKVNNGREILEEVDSNAEEAVGVYGSGGIFKYTNAYMHEGVAVMFGRKGTLGKPIYVDCKFWAVDTMYYLTYTSELQPRFSYYQLTAFDWIPHITQTALPSIVASQIVANHFPTPTIQEQDEIVTYLDQKCAEIDILIEKKTALLEEMETYKKSMIYEYVTGKKQVIS